MIRKLLGVLLLALVPSLVLAQAPATTNVLDTLVTMGSGGVENVNGSITITWEAFTSADDVTIPGGGFTYAITNGVVDLNLVPNEGATPAGTGYVVSYNLEDGTVYSRTWTVPSAGPVQVNDIESQTTPSPSTVVTISQLTGGPLSIALGGTGLSALGAANLCLKVNSGGTALEYGTCASGSGHTIQDEGSSLTQRSNLNFIGTSIACVDNAGNDATDCTVSGGSGSQHQVNGVNVTSNDPIDFQDVTGHISFTNPSAGVIEARLPSGTSTGEILIWDNALSEYVPGDPFVSGITAHDAAAAGTNPVLVGGYASAAAPTDVSATNDAVRAWYLLNGQQVVQLASSGALIPGDATNGLTVNLGTNNDVTVTSGTITTITNPVTVTDGAGPLNVIVDSGTVTANAGTGNFNVIGTGTAGSAATGVVTVQGIASMTPVLVDGSGVTQPVSGTVTANAGTGTFTVGQGTASNLNATVVGTGTFAVQVDAALPSGDNNIGNVDIVTMPNVTVGTFPDNEPFDVAQVNGSTAQVASAGLDTTGSGLLASALVGQLDDVATTAVTENQFAHIRINSSRALLVDGSGVTQPVSGTVTANAGSGPFPVSDNSGSLTIDAPVGTPVNVQIGDASNTATIRDLASNDALNVALVDASGNQVTSFGGGTQYTEDDVGAANPTGTTPVLIRQDTPGALVTTDGDVVAQRATNYGAAFVQVLDSSGNFINSFGGSGGTAINDDSAFTPGTDQVTPAGGIYRSVRDAVDDNDVGALAMTQSRALLVSMETPNADSAMDDVNDALRVNVVAGAAGGVTHTDDAAFTAASDDGVPAFAFFNDSTPDSVDEGDAGALRMSGNRNLYTTIRDAAGNERGVNVTASNELAVLASAQPGVDIGDVTINNASVAVTNGGTFVVQVDAALPSGTNNIGDVDVASMPNVTIGTFPDNEPFDVAQVNGSTVQVASAGLDTTGAGLIASALAGQLDDVATTTVTENQFAHLRINSSRALLVDGSAVTQPVSGTVTVTATDLDIHDLSNATDSVQVFQATGTNLHTVCDSGCGSSTQYTLGTDTYTEATSVGTLSAAVRNDTLATLADTDNELAPLQVDANGALYVVASAQPGVDIGDVTINNASIAVTNGGTFAVQESGAALTALQLIDDPVYTDDISTHATGSSKGFGIMAAATPTDGTVDANDIAMLAMSVDRRLLVDSQIVGQDSPLDVSAATVTVDNGGTFAVQVDAALPTGDNNIGNVDIVTFPDNEPFNVAQINGSTVQVATAGLDTTGAGLQASALTAQLDDVATTTVTENQFAHLRLNASRALLVDGSAVTQPVSGTVTVTATNLDIHDLSNATDSVEVFQATGTNLHTVCDSGCGSGTQYTLGTDTYTEATSVGTLAGAVRNDTLATLADTDNEIAPLQVDANGALYVIASAQPGVDIGDVTINNASIAVTDNGGALTVDNAGTFAVQVDAALPTGTNTIGSIAGITTSIVPGTAATNLGKAVDSAKGATDTGVQMLAIRDDTLSIFSNAENDYEPLHLTAAGRLYTSSTVDAALPTGANTIGSIASITTSVVPGTGATNLGKAEDAGHSSGDTGVAIWGVRSDADGSPTEFPSAELDYTPFAVDSFGTIPDGLWRPWMWHYHENSSSALTDTTVHASCGTGLYNYISTIVFSTGAATAFNLFIEDSTTATIAGPYYLEAVNGRGAVINFHPALKQTNSATLISVTTSAAIAHGIDITGFCGR